jgi:hypothetical protein
MTDTDTLETLPPLDDEDTQPSVQRPTFVRRPVTYTVDPNTLGASGRDFVFARSDEWKWEGKYLTALGPPGTWQLVDGFGVIWRCPRCKVPSRLMPQVSKVMPDGRVLVVDAHGEVVTDSGMRCMTPDCGWYARAYLDKAWGKTLYAIAVFNCEKERLGQDPREIYYGVGNSQREAMQQIILADYCTVIAVGPAIGFLVTDKHGERLIAEG